MGLPTVIGYERAARARVVYEPTAIDPYARWKNARNEVFAKRSPLFVLLVVAFLVVVAGAVRREELWVAATLGVGLIPIATEITCYYYSFLLAFGFLWSRRPSIGVALCGFAWVSYVIPELLDWYDEIFTWISLAAVLLVIVSTAPFVTLRGKAAAFARKP
jgi:hypothetical protein